MYKMFTLALVLKISDSISIMPIAVSKMPSHDADKWDERFVSATHSLPQVSYLIDCLYDADAALRKQTADSLLNDGTLHKIEKWNIAHRKEVLPCEENDTLAA